MGATRMNRLLLPALALLFLLFTGAYWKKKEDLSGYSLDYLTGTISSTIQQEYASFTKDETERLAEFPAEDLDMTGIHESAIIPDLDEEEIITEDEQPEDEALPSHDDAHNEDESRNEDEKHPDEDTQHENDDPKNDNQNDDTQHDGPQVEHDFQQTVNDSPKEEEASHDEAEERLSFYDIAHKYQTDKVDLHHYEGIYSHLLEPLREEPVKFLEIGLGCDSDYGPGASYHTWLEYFSKISLYFIEHNRECAEEWSHKSDNAKIYIGSQAHVKFLDKVIDDSGGQFDVIIDDGGHRMNQQRISLKTLWKALKPGGIYFIEDVQTSYMEKYGGTGGREKGDFMYDMKMLWDDVNAYEGRAPAFDWSAEVERVEFVKECIAIVKKRDVNA